MKKETYERKYLKLKEELKEQRKEDLLNRGYKKRLANDIINNAKHIYGYKLYDSFDKLNEPEYKAVYKQMKELTSKKWKKDKMISYINNWKQAIEETYIIANSNYAEDKLEEKQARKDAKQMLKVINDLKRMINKSYKKDDKVFFKVWNTLTDSENVEFANLYLTQIYMLKGAESIDGITIRSKKDVFEFYARKWEHYIRTIDKKYKEGKK